MNTKYLSSCWLLKTAIGLAAFGLPYFQLNYLTMKKNMGNTDRVIRILLALTFVSLYYFGVTTGLLGIALVLLGVVFVLTSFASFCPIYALFGMNSCPTKKAA